MNARYIVLVAIVLVSLLGIGAATGFVDSGIVGDTTPTPTATATEDPTTTTAEPTTTTTTTTSIGSSGGSPDSAPSAPDDDDGGSGDEPTTTTQTTTSRTTTTTTTQDGGSGPGEPVVEEGKGYPQSSTDSEVVEYQSGYRCLENPYRWADEDDYTYSEYDMWIPDRFVEDILQTDGVHGVVSVFEGEVADAGIAVVVLTDDGADPLVYCDADDSESVILKDDIHGDGDEGRPFTPGQAIAFADPTYDDEMTISDQAADWFVEKDTVEAVESTRRHTASGIETDVAIVVNIDYPPEDRRNLLPETVDGVEVTYTTE